jgi:transposase
MVEGAEVVSVSCPPEYRTLKKLLDRFKEGQIQVAYEAGPGGFVLYDQLVADGIDCVVTPPSLIPTEVGNKVKTDRRDSHKLARLLEANLLKRVWVLSPQERCHRQLVRTRRQIVHHRADVMKQIKSLLWFNGVEVTMRSGRPWTQVYLDHLRGLELEDQNLKSSLDTLLDLLEFLTDQSKGLTQQIRELSQEEKYRKSVELLVTIPGMGILSAMEILVELQDIRRFHRADQLAAYLGLTPSQYSSGEHIRMGSITHTGNERVRSTLVECSWWVIAKDLGMREKYDQLKHRRGAKRAIVAIARILSLKIRRMLLDEVNYQYRQPQRLAS